MAVPGGHWLVEPVLYVPAGGSNDWASIDAFKDDLRSLVEQHEGVVERIGYGWRPSALPEELA